MTPERVARVMANTAALAAAHGLWDKVCNTCNRSVGGRLAEYGKPTDDELKGLACPFCRDEATAGFRTEFVSPEK